MPGSYARLRRDWCLRGWTDVPAVAVDWTRAAQRELTQRGFYVAGACDGRTDFDSVAFLPEHRAALHELIAEGIAEPCEPGTPVEPWQRFRQADNPRLSAISWCVTGLCNLNCRHCYMQAPARRYGELPSAEMFRIVEQLERANVLEVQLTGGEPFVRPDLLDILAALAERKVWVSQIYSNGLLVTDAILDSIRGIEPSMFFQISFDGQGGHDGMRGRSGIEAGVVDAVRRIRAAGFPVAVATSVDRTNVGCLGDTYELLRRLDVQVWRIGAPQRRGNWRTMNSALSLDEEADACAAVLGRWLADGRPFAVGLGSFLNARGATDSAGSGAPPVWFEPDSHDCGSCRQNLNLLPDGTLVPCQGFVDTTLQERMPNLLHEDLSSLWRDSPLRVVADLRKRDLLARNPECAACQLFAHCGMGCRASALSETGDLMAPDPVACAHWKGGYQRRFQQMAGAGP